jgi:two-component system sensor histidine kinase YesM
MLHKYNQSVFYRIIIIFIGMMIPLYLLGTLLYLFSTSRLRAEISTNISSQMDFYLVFLENEVDRIRMMQIELMNDDDLIYLANAHSVMSNYEKTMAKQRVERRILLFKYSSEYLKRVDVDILEMGITISSEEGLIDLSPQFTTSLQQIGQSGEPILQMKDDGWVLHSVFPQMIPYENDPVFIVRAEMLRDSIDNHFSQSISSFGGTFAHFPESDLQYGQINDALNAAFIDAFSADPASSVVVDIPGQGKYLVIKKHSNDLGLDYYGYASEDEVFAPAKRIAGLFVVFSVAILAVVIIFAAFSSKTVHQPVVKLVDAFEHLDRGDLDVRIEAQSEDEFSYLYEAFNTTVENLKNLFAKVSNYEVLNREAQIKQLQAQISPHFLFNCLYIIYRMARMGDMENVVRFTNHLRTYYRYITRDAKNEVLLSEEIDHAQNYTAIQQVRFSNRIRIMWDDLPGGFDDLIVPRLILQPLIENAFQYGLKDVEENGLLLIHFQQNGTVLQISVENNGPVPTEVEMAGLKSLIFDEEYEGETTALRNIHRRISDLYGEACGIELLITEEDHFCVRMTIGKREPC